MKKEKRKGTIAGGLDKVRYVRIEGDAKSCGLMVGAEGPSKDGCNWISDVAKGVKRRKCGAFSPSGSMKIFKWTAKAMRPRQHFSAVGNITRLCCNNIGNEV